MKTVFFDNISIIFEYPGWTWLLPLEPGQLALVIHAMARTIDYKTDNLEVIIACDAFITAKNYEFFNIPTPTNILSFPPCAGFGGALILSLDTLGRESALYNQNFTLHLMRLLAHGMAHLAGYEHGSQMKAKEELLAQAGLLQLKKSEIRH